MEGSVIKRRYRVLSKLGAGGYGAVYTCLDRRQKRKVAVKVTRDIESLGQDWYREAGFLRALNKSTNIVRILDNFVNQGNMYLVLELIK
ncbi:extracellular signal-regulated kinase 2-like [Lampetra planeri]